MNVLACVQTSPLPQEKPGDFSWGGGGECLYTGYERTFKPRFTDTCLIRTLQYYGQFALSLGKESPNLFSKFNPLNTNTFYGPLSVLINGV